MNKLWMETDAAKEMLSDIDPESLDEACSMIYNLHEDALCLRSSSTELTARVARLEQAIVDAQNAFSLGAAENILNEVLFESLQQSLAHIQAEAVEQAVNRYKQNVFDGPDIYSEGLLNYANQLRQQADKEK